MYLIHHTGIQMTTAMHTLYADFVLYFYIFMHSINENFVFFVRSELKKKEENSNVIQWLQEGNRKIQSYDTI